MRHKVRRWLPRGAANKSLVNNICLSLFRHGAIKTTKTKAMMARRYVEKIITRAKKDTQHNRRQIARTIHDKYILHQIFAVIGPHFASRKGGYTRILKLGYARGGASPDVLFELVDRQAFSYKKKDEQSKKEGRSKKNTAPSSSVKTRSKPTTEKNKATVNKDASSTGDSSQTTGKKAVQHAEASKDVASTA